MSDKMEKILSQTLILGLFLLLASGVMVFTVKYKVQNLKRESATLESELDRNKERLHVLKAEWAYISKPSEIEKIVHKHLPNLRPVKQHQIQTIQVECD
jgi:cell division protein FtsL